jgi:PAS domain S-box-containing protein
MKEKLLILDDEALILTSLDHLFEDDYEVFTTADAETALRLAGEHDIAVILCDERMPGVCGHEFLRRVIGVSKATRVMISGYADLIALTDAVNSGQIFAYISKPWDPLALKATIHAAVVQFNLAQEVEQERELLRALMQNSPDSIYFKDCQSRFTRVNQAHAQILGALDPAECIGKSDADYFEAERALRSRQEDAEIVTAGRPLINRIEHIGKPQGGSYWTSTTKVPMFDWSGRVSGIAGVSRDITALKNTEEMLREQNERNRLILETALDAFIGMEPDGTITAWNPQAESIFGWTAAEAIGRPWCDLVVAPAHRAAHAHGVEQFLNTVKGPVFNQAIELAAVDRDGHEFPVEATIWPVCVHGASSFNAFVRDISKRRRAEEARSKETTLVQLLQSVTVAANQSSAIEHAAQVCLDRICSYTGWPVGHAYLRADDTKAPNSAELWHADENGPFAAFREASDRCGLTPGTELPGCILATGEPQWIANLADQKPWSERARAAVRAGLRSGFGFPIVVEEKVVGVLEFFSLHTAPPDKEFLTIVRNIGSQLGQVVIRRRAEDNLVLAKATAESANLAKSQFLTTMSHEIRTPMNAILGMADLLSESALDDEQQNYVRIFQRAGASLLGLINDILDFSKVEAGQVKLESIDFDPRGFLEKIIEMMASRAQDRSLHLRLEVLPGVPRGLVGDPTRVRQILINLIGNALKFTERGSVTLRVEQETGGMPGWLRFSVVDTGIGITLDKVEMIFGRFTQADSSTTRKYGGTGLGLAISKGLAELMGGRIGCVSEVGKGSTFYFAAPFGICKDSGSFEPGEEAAIASPPVGPGARQSRKRVLIVEDSEDNIVLTKGYLKGCGFELDFAENGKVAVEKVMSNHPDLVLMDLQMPVMDGLEATRAIRQWEKETHTHPTPILALTAHAGEEAETSSLEAGCNEHVTKPTKKNDLLAAIFRHLSGTIAITSAEAPVPNYLGNVRREMDNISLGD